MKKFDLFMLVTGLVSLVLAIVTSVVLIFVFTAAVKTEVESGKIEEGFNRFIAWVDNIGDENSDGFHIESDGTVVDIGPSGINVVDGDNTVNISPSGINVSPSEG